MRDPCPASLSGACLQLTMGYGLGVCPEDGVCDEVPEGRGADAASPDASATRELTSADCPYCPGPAFSWAMGPEGWDEMKRRHDAGHPHVSTAARR